MDCRTSRVLEEVMVRLAPLQFLCVLLQGCTEAANHELGDFRSYSAATGVNDTGLIVGTVREDRASNPLPVKFTGERKVVKLPLLSGDKACDSLLAGADGSVVGACTPADSSSGSRAVAWDKAGVARALGQPEPGWNTVPKGINSAGTIVGWTAERLSSDGVSAAWLCDASTGKFAFLPGLSGSYAEEALGINDAGSIVGSSSSEAADVGHRRVPVLWRGPDHAITALRVPAGCADGAARDINNQGVIAGDCDGHPLIWQTSDAEFEFLPAPALAPGEASIDTLVVALDDQSAIIGVAVHNRGDATHRTGVGWTGERLIVDLGDVDPSAINGSRLTVGTSSDARAVRIVW